MDYDSNTDALAAFFAVFAVAYFAFLAFFIVFAIAYWVVMAWSFMVLFRKVGIEPWIAWVPIYNLWKVLELGGFPGWMALLGFVPFGATVRDVFIFIGTYRTGLAFGKDGTWVLLAIFLLPAWGFLLGRKTEIYRPGVFVERGWKGPYAGEGSRSMDGMGF